MIEENLLVKYHAILKNFRKEDILFKKNNAARFYFQIQIGEVKLFNISSDGKEFIQSIYSENRGVGEAAILADLIYLFDCKVTRPSKIWMLGKADFLRLLKENIEVNLKVSKVISQRLHFMSLMACENSIESPEHRILCLLNYLKKTIYQKNEPFEFIVDLSRKEIGKLTGLRVETVIRAIKKLEKNNKLKLINRKVYI
jgi:CRP-like cAMP-binding protein